NSDGHQHINLITRGGWTGVSILGSIRNSPAADYYDGVSETTIPDQRGNTGVSDLVFVGCKLYGPEHHSGWRRADPLSPLNVDNEPLDMPAAVFIDGHGNYPSGASWGGNVANIGFISTRIQSMEA